MSRTIIRAWNAEGYHMDILVIDSSQTRMSDGRVTEPTASMLVYPFAPSMVIDPTKFPEMVKFQVIVEEYKR